MNVESLFDRLCSIEHLFASWKKFRRGKRLKPDVMAFERHLERNLFSLRDELLTGVYRHGPYQSFTIHDPKLRRISKATVRDRVVHQVVADTIEPAFDRRFIEESYSCRLGKGTHAAVTKLQSFLVRTSGGGRWTVYAMKCDVAQFFASVDHRALLDLLERRIADQHVLRLLECIIRSFSTMPGKGLPLGNLTSQLFANVYLHELDWFVKHEICVRWYLRYCDDFVFVGRSRARLFALIPAIAMFLADRLQLRLHPRKVIVRSWAQGIDFLGYVLLPRATVLRTRTKRRMLHRLTMKNASSYFGLCGHAATYQLQRIMQTKIGTERS